MNAWFWWCQAFVCSSLSALHVGNGDAAWAAAMAAAAMMGLYEARKS